MPAVLCILGSIFLINRLRDTPESLGLPPVEIYKNDPIKPGQLVAKDESSKEILRSVLTNRTIWLLSIANFFVYLVRYGALDWAPTFLVEVKGSTIGGAAMKGAIFELVGIGGALLAGRLSDTVFKGQRAWVNIIYMAALAFAVFEFWMIPKGYPVLDALALAAVGFLVYGPQMLVGVSAADVAGKNAAATATGFTGLFGYLGSIVSGVGTGLVVDHYGWSGGFLFFVISAAIGTICFVATLRRRAH